MTDRKAEGTTTRRDALKLVGLGAPVAAAAAVGAAPAEAATPEAERAGLRKTAHVAKYLETARF